MKTVAQMSLGMQAGSLVILLVCLAWAGMASAAEDKEKPEGKIRSPRAGEEVEHAFTAKGRTRNVPDGYLVILFRPVGEDDFLYPCSAAFKANRSFSEKIYHEKTDEGACVLQVRMVPEKIAEKITAWRAEHSKWDQGGKKGPQPGFTIAWLESTKRLTEVEYKLEKY